MLRSPNTLVDLLVLVRQAARSGHNQWIRERWSCRAAAIDRYLQMDPGERAKYSAPLRKKAAEWRRRLYDEGFK